MTGSALEYRGEANTNRAYCRHPELVTHVFSVCTPYTPPHKEYVSTEDMVKTILPQFQYQVHLASGEVEKSVKDEQSIRQFLKGMYGGRGPNGEYAFDPCKGVLVDNLPLIGESKLLNGKVSARSSFRHQHQTTPVSMGSLKATCHCRNKVSRRPTIPQPSRETTPRPEWELHASTHTACMLAFGYRWLPTLLHLFLRLGTKTAANFGNAEALLTIPDPRLLCEGVLPPRDSQYL